MRRPRIDEALTEESRDLLQLIPGDVVSWDLDMTPLGYTLDFMVVTGASRYSISGCIISMSGRHWNTSSYARLHHGNLRQVRFVQRSTGNVVLIGSSVYVINGDVVARRVQGSLASAFDKVMRRRHARGTHEAR